MHRLSIAAILVSTLALPGCIFAIGTGKDHWKDGMVTSSCEDGESCSMCCEHMEAQINLIERHLKGECKPDCPYCKPGAAKDETKPASADAAKTPAPAKAKP